MAEKEKTMAETALIDFLANLPTHGLLIVFLVVLWRENQSLRKRLDDIYDSTKSNTALLLGQNNEIDSIKTHVTGQTPARGFEPPKFSDS
jgi:hypothetical protein